MLMETFGFWPDTPTYIPKWLPGASFQANITPEYLCVGYIIGPRIAAIIFAGGVFSWLVLMPAIKFFGSMAPSLALYPSTVPIPLMSSDQLWASYIRPMGAGAVAAAGAITPGRTIPPILAAPRAGLAQGRLPGWPAASTTPSSRPSTWTSSVARLQVANRRAKPMTSVRPSKSLPSKRSIAA